MGFGHVRKLPSDNYQALYYVDGKRKAAPGTFPSEKSAELFLSKMHVAISEGTYRDPVEVANEAVVLTLGEFTEKAIRLYKDLTPATQDEYERYASSPRLAPLMVMDITQVTQAVVQDWWDERPKTSPSENHHQYAFLRSVFNEAVLRRQRTKIMINPCSVPKTKPKKTKSTAKSVKVLGDAQTRELADQMGSQGPGVRARLGDRYTALVMLTAYCALRFGEATELRVKDLNVKPGCLSITRAVTWVNPKRLTEKQQKTTRLTKTNGTPLRLVPVVGPPKSVAGVRDLPIPGFLRPMLEEHVRLHAEQGLGLEALIFPALGGGHMSHGSLYKVFRLARTRIGRGTEDVLKWHHLRHTGAVYWRMAGADIPELMDLLGHETMSMAMHYQHVERGRMERIAEVLSDRVIRLNDSPTVPEDITVMVDEAQDEADAL